MPRTARADQVELPELLEFLRPRHRAVLITTRRDGLPQSSPLSCGVDSAADDWDGPYGHRDGHADVRDMPDAREGLVEYFRAISGEHPDWDDYRAAMHRQDKSLITVTIERWGPIATGGFPPEFQQGH